MSSSDQAVYCSSCRLPAHACNCAMLSHASTHYFGNESHHQPMRAPSSDLMHSTHQGYQPGFYPPPPLAPSAWQHTGAYPPNQGSYGRASSATPVPAPLRPVQFSNVYADTYQHSQQGASAIAPAGIAPARGRKRPGDPLTSNPASKRRSAPSSADKENTAPSGQQSSAGPPPTVSPVPGIGPVLRETAPVFDPKSTYGSILNKNKPKHNSSAATDVWWFCVALREWTKGKSPETVPDTMSTYLMKRPSEREFKGLGCRLCKPPAKMHTWANADGLTDTIRTHLMKEHGSVWREFVLLNHLKGWERVDLPKEASGDVSYDPSEFTLTGFYERLVRWIIADDQSLNVVDCPELRDLLLYLGTQLEPSQLPHRTHLSNLILQRFVAMCDTIRDEMKGALGRISLTSDMWSKRSLEPFMAVTAHYIIERNGRLELKARLIAFKRIEGAHDGDTLGNAMFSVIKEWGILNKLGFITLDNASNCNTMIRRLARLLREAGVDFSVEENRIRCFPHVVNLCVKAGLRYFAEVGPEKLTEIIEDSDDFISSLQDELAGIPAYDVGEDVVAIARKLVNVLRASGQRLDDLSEVIQKAWKDKTLSSDDVPDHAVLKDMDVRWSSTFLMIDRLLELYPAIVLMAEMEKYEWLRGYLLTDEQLRRLDKIREFLAIPHSVQEAISADKTPTLPVALPAYEQLLSVLKAFKEAEPELATGVQAAIDKLEEYFQKTRSARVHALAMIINPTIKLEWLSANWTASEVEAAKETMITAMAEYQRVIRESRPTANTTAIPQNPATRSIARPTASRAARKQRNVMQTIGSLCRTYSNSSAASEASAPASASEQEDNSPSALLAADRKAAEAAFKRYCDEGVLCDPKKLDDFDILRWWEHNRHDHELVYRVALDILPAQASAVPCERVFSSAKETDTLRRNGLNPVMMEALQICKFSLKADRLDFRDGWVAEEEDLTIEVADVDPGVLQTLLDNRELDKLEALLEAAYSGAPLAYGD